MLYINIVFGKGYWGVDRNKMLVSDQLNGKEKALGWGKHSIMIIVENAGNLTGLKYLLKRPTTRQQVNDGTSQYWHATTG